MLPQRDISSRSAWTRILLLVVVWTIVFLAYNGLRELTPDEAYYWTWSRHLAGGYLDHPPMVALMIRAGTALFGTSEFAVRFFATIFSAGTILIEAMIADRIAGPPAALAAAVILACSPLIGVMGTIITPDTPAYFFWALALLSAVSGFRAPPQSARRVGWWIVLGISIGLGMLSKYTAVLAGASIAAAVFSSRQGREELKRPGVWLALLMSIICFSPTLIWNQAHQWESFRFQLSHGLGESDDSKLVSFLSYWPGQALVWTPILFIVTLAALWHFWARLRSSSVEIRILLFSATLPLVFFWYSSLRHHVELNWPAAAYIAGTVLLVQYVSQNPLGERKKWTEIGVIVAACAMIVLHFPEIWALTPASMRVPAKWGELFGWREMAAQVDAAAPRGAVVYCSTYESAAEISFYRAGHQQAWVIDSNRPSAFDYFDPPPPNPEAQTAIVYVRNLPRDFALTKTPNLAPPDVITRDFALLQVQWREYRFHGHALRWRQFFVGQR